MRLLIEMGIVFICTFMFAITYNIKKQKSFLASFASVIGWLVKHFSNIEFKNEYLSVFLAALTISLVGEFLAIKKHAPATVFIIPGIIPLVPGSNMYYSMLAVINDNLDVATYQGLKAIFYAVAISCGIIVSLSITRLIKNGFWIKKSN